MYQEEKKELLKACLKLKEYKLISLTGGNIAVRLNDGNILVTPSGMLYEEMIEDDICVMNVAGEKIEGKRRPSSDFGALLHIFKEREDVNAIIHTHQPYATAVGFDHDKLPVCMVTLIDAVKDDVQVAPWNKSSDTSMGVLALKYLGNSKAVIMKHHGVITIGENLKEALYAAIYLEEGAKTYCIAKMIGKVPELSKKQVLEELGTWDNYGQ